MLVTSSCKDQLGFVSNYLRVCCKVGGLVILVYYKITGVHVSVCASVSEKHSEHLGMSRGPTDSQDSA